MRKIDIKKLFRLSKNNEIIPLHFILGNRQQNKFGEINNIFNVNYHPQLQTSEINFSIYKTVNGEECRLWDEIINRRLLWVKEYDEWFEIYVDIDDSEKVTKKNVKGINLCQAELSQVDTPVIEINTEEDISRDDYEVSVFYNPNNKKASTLHRLLNKAPNYTIKHVDTTLHSIKKTFSISEGNKLYDFLTGTISEEIGCLFLFDSNERGIYVYDMQTTCLECGYRDEQSFKICPKCGNKILHSAYGKDTTILIDKNNLGKGIQLSSNSTEVKNCFQVSGGDEIINAAIASINPNGSQYIYIFDEDTRSDMPNTLVEKLDNYNRLQENYKTTHEYKLSENIVKAYNDVIKKINNIYPDSYNPIELSYIGYNSIIEKYYDSIDLKLYLESSMMPTFKQSDITAKTEVEKIYKELKVVSVKDSSNISKSTADSAVLLMARAIVNTKIYKIKIQNSSITSQFWTGQISLTNVSDEDDTATTSFITITINDDYLSYVKQKIEKEAAKIDDLQIKDIYKIENLDEFRIELKKYSLSRLKSFQNVYETIISILQEEGFSNKESEFYKTFYLSYYEKSLSIENELSIRDTDVGIVITLQKELLEIMKDTQEALNLEKYIGFELWKVFLCYKREDKYHNENYISDGLSNSELVKKANELITVATNELIKSSQKQYTITATLHNLLLILDENGEQIFKPILDDFELGNYINCKIDGVIYKMRIIDITIDYDNLSELSITFCDVVKGGNIVNKMSELIGKTNSIVNSYSSTIKQAQQGEKANYTLEKLQKEGLDSAQYNVFSQNAKIIVDNYGILGRNYDDVYDVYSDEQIRINGSNLIMTNDAWLSTTLAIGKQKYTLNGEIYEVYGVNANTVIGGTVIAGQIFSANYKTDKNGNVIDGTHIDLQNGNFTLAGGDFSYDRKERRLKLKNIDIDWTLSSPPSTSDVIGMKDLESELNSNISNVDNKLNNFKGEQAESNKNFSDKINSTNQSLDGLTNDFSNFKKQTQTNFSSTNGAIQITTTHFNDFTTEFYRYIRFEDGKILLGESNNQISLTMKNNRVYFSQDDKEIAYFSDKKFYVLDGEFVDSLSIANLVITKKKNGNISFNIK